MSTSNTDPATVTLSAGGQTVEVTVPDQHASETLVAQGEELKSLEVSDNIARVGGYAIRFGSADEKDLTGEYFTKATDFGRNNGDGAMTMFNHGQAISENLKSLADRVFASAKSVKDDIGVFMETCLNLADDYEKAIFDLVTAGKLRWSSGSASHVVKKAPDGEITRWPIVEVSYTPMAAEPRLPAIAPLKSIIVGDEVAKEIVAAFTKSAKKTAAPVDTPQRATMADKTEPTPDAAKFDRDAEIKAIRETELKRQASIKAIGAKFAKFGGADKAEKAINDGLSVDDFRTSFIDSFNPEAVKTAPAEKSDIRVMGERGGNFKTIGTQVGESEEYKKFVREGSGSQKSFKVDVPTKTTQTTGITGFATFDRQPGVVMVEQQRLTIRDLLATGTTAAQSVKYIQETSFTNSAAMVAEGGAKPEAEFALEEKDAPVRKLAIIGRVTEELFADFPAMRDYIDNRLRFMVKQTEETQLLSGDGSGQNLTGILSTSGIQTQSGASNPMDAFLDAINKVRTIGQFEPDGIVVHPNNFNTFRKLKDSAGQYYGGGPFSYGPYGNSGLLMQPPIWGLPVVVTTAIAEGTALVGAFKLGAQIFDREGLRVETTNTDGDDWKYNRVAVRLEERLALAVYRPLAFCEITSIS